MAQALRLQGRVPRGILLSLLGVCALFVFTTGARADGLVRSKSRFYYKTKAGQVSSARVIRQFYGRINIPVVHPDAPVDPRIDPRLRRAATLAEERAHARSQARCWRSVKQALLAAGVVSSYPKTAYARDAGTELVRDFGFKRLPVRDPYAAPIGSVIVYGRGPAGAGHVEIRTKTGFVSDYKSKSRCFYPLLAVYGKFSS